MTADRAGESSFRFHRFRYGPWRGGPDPLAPPDTESPRATMLSLKKEIEAAEQTIIATYKRHI